MTLDIPSEKARLLPLAAHAEYNIDRIGIYSQSQLVYAIRDFAALVRAMDAENERLADYNQAHLKTGGDLMSEVKTLRARIAELETEKHRVQGCYQSQQEPGK